MTMTSTARSTPSASTIPFAGHGRDRVRHELDVVLLERAVERAGDDRTLAGIGVLRRDGLAEIRTVGELALRCRPGRTAGGSRWSWSPAGRGARATGSSPAGTAAANVRAAARHGRGERGALGFGQVALAFRHDPPGLALEHVELLHDRRDRRHDLRGRRTGADHRHDLARQVVAVLPSGGVELGSGEVVETRPVGIPRHVEETDRARRARGTRRRCRLRSGPPRRGGRRPTSPKSP